MPAYGRSDTNKAGVIFPGELPSLPIPIAKGRFSLSLGFEQKPQATLEYEGILQADIRQFEEIYIEGYLFSRRRYDPIKIAGYPFWPVSYTYERDHSDIERVGRVHAYKVSINLEWAWQRACEGEVFIYKRIPTKSKSLNLSALAGFAGVPYTGPSITIKLSGQGDKETTMSLDSALQEHARRTGCFVHYGKSGVSLRRLGTGNTWNFPTEEILTDGGNTLALPVAYRNASLSFGEGDQDALGESDQDDDDDDEAGNQALRFFRESANKQVVEEFDENYRDPPEDAGTAILKSLDSNWDMGGPTKTYRRRELIGGQPLRETVQIWGFAYLASQIHVGGGKLRGNPSDYWRIVEEQQTEYVYRPAPPSVISLFARDSTGRSLSMFVHPSYRNAPGISSGSASSLAAGTRMGLSSSAQFLTEVITTGWTLNRFVKEDGDSDTWHSLRPTDSKHPLVFFQEIPKVSGQMFRLESERTLYPVVQNVSSPFSVEWTDFESLGSSEKSYIRNSPTALGTNRQDSAGRVGLVTPDLNFVEPYHVMQELTFSNSFAYVDNPDAAKSYDPTSENTAGDEFVREHYITGDESWTLIERRINPGDPDKYTEKTTEYSARNSNFGDSASIIQYKDVYGRPPQPTVLQLRWEQKESGGAKKSRVGTNPGSNTAPNSKTTYRVTTDFSGNIAEGGSFSYPSARTLQEATTAVVTDLRIAEMQAMQEQKVLTWYYPNLEIGDRLITGDDRYETYGRWRITQVSWSGEVDGAANWLNPLCTIEGTQVTCGLDRDRQVNISTDKEKEDGNPTNGGGNPDLQLNPRLTVTAKATGVAIDTIRSMTANRRTF